MATHSTTIRKAADAVLRAKHDVGLEEWLRERFREGLTLREISRQLWLDTGQTIDVSKQAIANWRDELIGGNGEAA